MYYHAKNCDITGTIPDDADIFLNGITEMNTVESISDGGRARLSARKHRHSFAVTLSSRCHF